MPYEITMPQLGESVTEGQIVRWLKGPGDRIERFEPIVQVLTDKVTVEVPSPAAGVLLEIRAPEGETVPVGAVLAVLEPSQGATPGPEPGQARPLPVGVEAAAAAGALSPGQRATAESAPAPPADETRGFYSPAVRRLAREHGIDLSTVRGTGEGGRITREDVLRAVREREEARPAPPPAAEEDEVEVEPSPVRAVIARRMAESWANVPHAWTMVEADVTALVALRQQAQESFYRREGFELTFLPFAIRAVADALREFPDLNASWVQGRIRRHRRIHIGVAVGLEEALLVPVVRDADRLSVVGIARAVHDLVRRARSGELTADDLQGATFTVNNTGALGSVLSAPIISPPQGAILTTEAVTKRLVVLKDDQLAIRSIMNLCLSFDHRLADGVQALRFLHAVKRRLEAFGPGTPLT